MQPRISVSCGWCHKLVRITGTPTYCPACSHRVDVSRLRCNCARCHGGHREPKPDELLDLDALERALTHPEDRHRVFLCRKNYVDSLAGEDICRECLADPARRSPRRPGYPG